MKSLSTASMLMLMGFTGWTGGAQAQAQPVITGRYEQPHSLPYFDWMALSPDGSKVAFSPAGSGVYIRSLDGSGAEVGQGGIVQSGAAAFDDKLGGADSLRWSDDSSRLYLGVGALKPVTLRPAVMTPDGAVRENPEPTHPNGPLDALLYAGGGGQAVAQFGTTAHLRWPQQVNETPTFAIVDTNTGVIRSTLTYEDALRGRMAADADRRRMGLWRASAALLPDSRVRLIAQMSYPTNEGFGGTEYVWMLWTEGDASALLDDPYPGNRGTLLLSPDGAALLVTSSLTAISFCPADATCAEPARPAEGMVAALHETQSGRRLWEIRGVARTFNPLPTPAISPDGRYALIGLPAEDWTNAHAALVSMESGRTLAEIPVDVASYHVGFSRGGRQIWIHRAREILTYDLESLVAAGS